MPPLSSAQRTISFVALLGILGAAAVFGVGFYVGNNYAGASVYADTASSTALGSVPGVDMGPFWSVWRAIEERYVPSSTSTMPTKEERVHGAIQGLANSLEDPYTVFLPPRESRVFEEDVSGNFEGVGMEIGIRDDILTVIAPLEGTPASRAGVESGDKIVEIDGTTTEDMTVEEAVQLIRGERGSEVVLTMVREGEPEPLEIGITRDRIQIPTITTEARADGVFVIKLHNFSAISPGLFRNALREFVQAGGDDLVVDLRGNPGGYLEASVNIASWFLPTGEVVVREYFGEGRGERVHRTNGQNIFDDDLNLVVLINQGSASASEILAGALREHGVATLIGEQTFGKGSVQELVETPDDTSFKVTIARWLTPEGVSISENGLEPDITVEMTREDVLAGEDPQMERAVEFLLSQ